MATVTKWSNVAVAVQSAIAATKTINSISLANPGVVNSTAHGYSNGDYVFLLIQGMFQLDQRVVRVASVAADTFQLEGIDTTAFSAFVSGTAQKLTYGTSVTSVVGVNSSGGTFSFEDTTTIHGNQKTQVPQLPDALSYTMEHIWDPADAGQIALKAAADSQAQRALKFTFGVGGKIVVFAGYVGHSGAPGGQAQGKVTTSGAITANGSMTFYAS